MLQRLCPTASPILRELARNGGGEDSLAKALEDVGHAVEPFAAGVHPRKDRVKLVGDALLFVGWSNLYW
jgi:hypothetical protein